MCPFHLFFNFFLPCQRILDLQPKGYVAIAREFDGRNIHAIAVDCSMRLAKSSTTLSSSPSVILMQDFSNDTFFHKLILL